MLTAIDANTGVGGNQAFTLDQGGAFTAGEIRQTQLGADLLLEMNTDSDAAAEMSVLLKRDRIARRGRLPPLRGTEPRKAQASGDLVWWPQMTRYPGNSSVVGGQRVVTVNLSDTVAPEMTIHLDGVLALMTSGVLL